MSLGSWCSGFSDDSIPLTNAGIVRQAPRRSTQKQYFISLHEDPTQRDFGFNEHIAKEHFHICGATGGRRQYDVRDVMIAYDAKAHGIQHLSAESVR